IERAVAFAASDVIELEDLPPPVGGRHLVAIGESLKKNETLRAWARRYARIMLERRDGNKRETARVLGISPHTLTAYLRLPVGDAAAGEEWPQDADDGDEKIGATGAA